MKGLTPTPDKSVLGNPRRSETKKEGGKKEKDSSSGAKKRRYGNFQITI